MGDADVSRGLLFHYYLWNFKHDRTSAPLYSLVDLRTTAAHRSMNREPATTQSDPICILALPLSASSAHARALCALPPRAATALVPHSSRDSLFVGFFFRGVGVHESVASGVLLVAHGVGFGMMSLRFGRVPCLEKLSVCESLLVALVACCCTLWVLVLRM